MNRRLPLGFEIALSRVVPPCPSCRHTETVRSGRNSAGHQRYLCRSCAFRFVASPKRSPSHRHRLGRHKQLVLPVDFRLVPPPRNQRFSNSELLRLYRYYPQIEIRDRLVEQNMGLVRKLAHQSVRTCKEPYDDLEQEGFKGLLRAIAQYDPDKGTQFSTFAMPYIKGRIAQYLRDRSATIKIPRTLYELMPRENRVRQQLALDLKRSPTDREVAEALGESVTRISDLKEAKRNCKLVSLDVSLSENDGVLSLVEAIATKSPEPESDLPVLLQNLEPELSRLLWAVFVEEKPKKVLAAEMGRSVLWLNRHIQIGIEKLRAIAST